MSTPKSSGRNGFVRQHALLTQVVCSVVLSLVAAAALSISSHPRVATTDEYPMRNAVSSVTLDDGSSQWVNDPYGFVVRQCVSFVGWKLREAGYTAFANEMTIHGKRVVWGSASHWDVAAREAGFTVSTTPRAGAVAQWRANEASATENGEFVAGVHDHVGIVVAVDGKGWVSMAEYNGKVDQGFSVVKVKAPRYLYIAR